MLKALAPLSPACILISGAEALYIRCIPAASVDSAPTFISAVWVFIPEIVCAPVVLNTVESTVILSALAVIPAPPITFRVTVPLVPPPVIPVPAVTPVISPCGIVGNVVKLPAPFIYCALVPPTAISTDGFTAASLPILTANALPPCVAATDVTVPVLLVLLLNVVQLAADKAPA